MRFLNEVNINIVNYYVIFDKFIELKFNYYLYNCFINKIWDFKEFYFKIMKDIKYKWFYNNYDVY